MLVLAGVAVSALLGAGISLLKLLADPYTQLPSITFWLLGGLNAVVIDDLKVTAPLLLIGLLPLVLLRWRVNLLGTGDEEASALGVAVTPLRWTLIAAATLCTAAAVSLAGIIGWVGLVVPHIARLLVGADFRRLLPASLLLGASFLLAADTLARTRRRSNCHSASSPPSSACRVSCWCWHAASVAHECCGPASGSTWPGHRPCRRGTGRAVCTVGAARRGAVPAWPERLWQDHPVPHPARPAACGTRRSGPAGHAAARA
ncbi:iron ABC transporter permease [Stenotrophomonas sp. CD2]|nr:iron ABC transporter permease [Stenotrophomonas sp. CD2]